MKNNDNIQESTNFMDRQCRGGMPPDAASLELPSLVFHSTRQLPLLPMTIPAAVKLKPIPPSVMTCRYETFNDKTFFKMGIKTKDF
jgi:hypothetical protein